MKIRLDSCLRAGRFTSLADRIPPTPLPLPRVFAILLNALGIWTTPTAADTFVPTPPAAPAAAAQYVRNAITPAQLAIVASFINLGAHKGVFTSDILSVRPEGSPYYLMTATDAAAAAATLETVHITIRSQYSAVTPRDAILRTIFGAALPASPTPDRHSREFTSVANAPVLRNKAYSM